MATRPGPIAVVVTVLCLGFLTLPLGVIIPEAFSSANYLLFPPPGYSTDAFERALSDSSWTDAFLVSLKVATLAAGVAVSAGTLAALALDGARFRGKTFVILILISPLVVPPVVLGIASYGAFTSIGFDTSLTSLVFAHALLGLPFVFLSVSGALGTFDKRLKAAAQSLGARPARVFREITLPLIAPGVIVGAILAFLVSFNDVVLATFLAGQRTQTLPMRMVIALEFEFDPTIAAVSAALLSLGLIAVTVVAILRYAQERIDEGRTA